MKYQSLEKNYKENKAEIDERFNVFSTEEKKVIVGIAQEYKLERPEYIFIRRRKREVVSARNMFIYWLYKTQCHTLTKIGDLVGGYDHTNILHATKSVEADLINYDDTKRIWQWVKVVGKVEEK